MTEMINFSIAALLAGCRGHLVPETRASPAPYLWVAQRQNVGESAQRRGRRGRFWCAKCLSVYGPFLHSRFQTQTLRLSPPCTIRVLVLPLSNIAPSGLHTLFPELSMRCFDVGCVQSYLGKYLFCGVRLLHIRQIKTAVENSPSKFLQVSVWDNYLSFSIMLEQLPRFYQKAGTMRGFTVALSSYR